MEDLLKWIIGALFTIITTGGGILMRQLFGRIKTLETTDREQHAYVENELKDIRKELNTEVSELKNNYITRFESASKHRNQIKVEMVKGISEIKVLIAQNKT
jgi:LPS O-antigen subunit length determinant protein (WzzB/FepE family)